MGVAQVDHNCSRNELGPYECDMWLSLTTLVHFAHNIADLRATLLLQGACAVTLGALSS